MTPGEGTRTGRVRDPGALWFIVYMGMGNAQFTRGIFVVYLTEGRISLLQFGLLESVFHAARLVTEVPAGALADRWGRRRAIRLGLLAGSAGVVMLLWGGGFAWYAAAFAAQGAGWALQRGADTALLYSHLERLGQEETFSRVLGRSYAASYGTLAVSTLVGSALYEIRGWLPFVLHGAVVSLACLAVQRVPETRAAPSGRERPAGLGRIIAEGTRTVLRHPLLRVFIGFVALLEAGTTVISIYSQDFFTKLSYSPSAVGLILSLVTAFGAVAAAQSHRMTSRGPGAVLLGASVLYMTGLVAMSSMNRFWSVIGYYLVFLNLDLLAPVLSQFFNRVTSDSVRATASSYLNLSTSLVTFVAFPLAGGVLDGGSYRALMLWCAAASVPLLSLLALVYRRAQPDRTADAAPAPYEPPLNSDPTGS